MRIEARRETAHCYTARGRESTPVMTRDGSVSERGPLLPTGHRYVIRSGCETARVPGPFAWQKEAAPQNFGTPTGSMRDTAPHGVSTRPGIAEPVAAGNSVCHGSCQNVAGNSVVHAQGISFNSRFEHAATVPVGVNPCMSPGMVVSKAARSSADSCSTLRMDSDGRVSTQQRQLSCASSSAGSYKSAIASTTHRDALHEGEIVSNTWSDAVRHHVMGLAVQADPQAGAMTHGSGAASHAGHHSPVVGMCNGTLNVREVPVIQVGMNCSYPSGGMSNTALPCIQGQAELVQSPAPFLRRVDGTEEARTAVSASTDSVSQSDGVGAILQSAVSILEPGSSQRQMISTETLAGALDCSLPVGCSGTGMSPYFDALACHSAADTALAAAVESRASQIMGILGQIRDLNLAQQQSEREYKAEQCRLEQTVSEERQRTEELSQQLWEESAQQRLLTEEVDTYRKQLEEERQKSQVKSEAARRMCFALFEQKFEERDAEFRKVLEEAQQREQVQEARIAELTEQLSQVSEQKAADSIRRRLFPAAMVPDAALVPSVSVNIPVQQQTDADAQPSSHDNELADFESTQQQDYAAITITPPKVGKESPPRGCVAEKVNIFEHKLTTPGSLSELLKRGPRAAAVPTPCSAGRHVRSTGGDAC